MVGPVNTRLGCKCRPVSIFVGDSRTHLASWGLPREPSSSPMQKESHMCHRMRSVGEGRQSSCSFTATSEGSRPKSGLPYIRPVLAISRHSKLVDIAKSQLSLVRSAALANPKHNIDRTGLFVGSTVPLFSPRGHLGICKHALTDVARRFRRTRGHERHLSRLYMLEQSMVQMHGTLCGRQASA